MIETTILEYLHKLPNSLQQEVLHYTQFLLETHAKNNPLPQKKRQAGFNKKIVEELKEVAKQL